MSPHIGSSTGSATNPIDAEVKVKTLAQLTALFKSHVQSVKAKEKSKEIEQARQAKKDMVAAHQEAGYSEIDIKTMFGKLKAKVDAKVVEKLEAKVEKSDGKLERLNKKLMTMQEYIGEGSLEHYRRKLEEAEQERLNFKLYMAKQKALDDKLDDKLENDEPLADDGDKAKKRKADDMVEDVKKPRYE